MLPSRDALAATIAPVTGPGCRGDAARDPAAPNGCRHLIATRRTGLPASGRPVTDRGLTAGTSGDHDLPGRRVDRGSRPRYAWLTLVLTSLRVRDDAWARMDPDHRDAHLRLWTDLVRRAQPGYIAAPASLLAFTAWQAGDGALANLALDRALADDPGYSMAKLLRDVLDAGTPPSTATPPDDTRRSRRQLRRQPTSCRLMTAISASSARRPRDRTTA